MKAQFKYAFRAGFSARGIVFTVIFTMNLVFIILGSLRLLPLAALITAVSLGGTAIAVMMALNIVGDVAIVRRMFAAPGAYLHALTPAPRRQILISSTLTMMVMDIVTMAVVIIGEVWLSLILAGDNIGDIVFQAISTNAPGLWYGFSLVALLISGYLLVMMIILFSVTMRKSVFYQKPAGGLLTALLSIGVIYATSLSTLLLAPFGTVSRFGIFFTVTIGWVGSIFYILLTLIQAAVLFILTAKLMERRMNI